ncbi:protein-L-isoaspartate O-methyltransferase family protein [Gulosibacter molinativorax]|uniref:Protein-L-isoaspartate O-methyltransferase n=2 Tax=Gulosibacter molinativorax TaxID=256821 RepID=A0ABT7C6T0_9MICO|nr:protein-L-isoaspartate O-methyltransferase [Gulosibacter molinativorax]MDJ1370512.1 protein-L-isoaspartate O-methyltransferase [Gulosibacter molinativorax]QUY62077.1 Protein-L-isoaspartate O-methyltransferase [Gulosibacter molinativorax]
MAKHGEDTVVRVMREVDRAAFLPSSQRGRAGFDGPIRIGFGQTNSQPRTVANMLRLLDVQPGQRVLDVGSGSGWSTALLGELVGPEGTVIGVERVPELVVRSREALDARGRSWVEVREALPGTLGWPEDGPFDRILVSAEARELPEQLVEQLAVDGRMVIPVRSRMLLVTKDESGIEVSAHGAYLFVPLIEG